MGKTRFATVLVSSVVLLAGCGEGSGPSGAGADPTPAPSTASAASAPDLAEAGKTIPDGSYTRTVTEADAQKLGLPEDRAVEILGQDGEFVVDLRVADDNFAQFADDGDGPMTLGDGGTATYDADGNWVTTSDSAGCPGCTATWRWSYVDGRLTLKLLDTTESGDPVDLLIGRLIFEGEFTAR